jgi:hypothetical protein
VVYPENVLGMSGKFLWDNLLPPVANFSGKKFLDAFFIRKVPLKAWPPQLLEASYAHDWNTKIMYLKRGGG